jgi:hypothetical protein
MCETARTGTVPISLGPKTDLGCLIELGFAKYECAPRIVRN